MTKPEIKKPQKKTKAKPPKKKKRRRRGGHYKTGVHLSQKCSNGPAIYRSGWEKVVCEHLDKNPDVLEYQYEPFEIKYVSNHKTGRIRKYIPDFLVIFSNGTKKLIEVKRQKQINNRTVKKKTIAAKAYASRNNLEYEFWTEEQIQKIRKELKAETKQKTSKKSSMANKKK